MQEADLSKPFKEKIKVICNNQVELKSNETCKPEEKFIENCEEIPPIPTNSVQFLINWKKYTSFDFRYRYLKVSNKFLHMKSMNYIEFLFSKYHQVACLKYFEIQWKLISSVVF